MFPRGLPKSHAQILTREVCLGDFSCFILLSPTHLDSLEFQDPIVHSLMSVWPGPSKAGKNWLKVESNDMKSWPNSASVVAQTCSQKAVVNGVTLNYLPGTAPTSIKPNLGGDWGEHSPRASWKVWRKDFWHLGCQDRLVSLVSRPKHFGNVYEFMTIIWLRNALENPSTNPLL